MFTKKINFGVPTNFIVPTFGLPNGLLNENASGLKSDGAIKSNGVNLNQDCGAKPPVMPKRVQFDEDNSTSPAFNVQPVYHEQQQVNHVQQQVNHVQQQVNHVQQQLNDEQQQGRWKSNHNFTPKQRLTGILKKSHFTPESKERANVNQRKEGINNEGNTDFRQEMEKLRKVVSWHDERIEIIGHKKVKNEILSAFLLANCLDNPLDPSVSCQHILIAGCSGLGKSDLLKGQAIEASKLIKRPISVFNVKASDLLSKYIGESEKAIAALMDCVEYYNPSIVIFDEIDGLAKQRVEDENDSTRRFKTSLLSELRGNRLLRNVVVVAATNRPAECDINLQSRFKLKFVVRPPTPNERQQIFEKFIRICEKSLDVDRSTIDFEILKERTNGFSGNDIATVLALAASYSFRLVHGDQTYEVEDLDAILQEIESMDEPVKATMLPITMDSILFALGRVKPSISSKEAKELNKWAEKNCDLSEDQFDQQVAKPVWLEMDDADICCTSCLPF